MTTRRPVDPLRTAIVAVVLVAIVAVVGAGVARNRIDYTAVAGGLFVIVGYLLREKKSDGGDE
jgi:hypothetical protein